MLLVRKQDTGIGSLLFGAISIYDNNNSENPYTEKINLNFSRKHNESFYIIQTFEANKHLVNFKSVYVSHFERLFRYSFTITKDNDEAEDVVQTIFARLWEKQDKLQITSDLTAYLYRSVHNESLNRRAALKKRMQMNVNYSASAYAEESAYENKHQLSEEEISRQIDAVLNQMPEQCRRVFLKSRIDNLKYSEIAAELGISEKTVEAHMSKALKIIRTTVRVIVLLISLIAYLSFSL